MHSDSGSRACGHPWPLIQKKIPIVRGRYLGPGRCDHCRHSKICIKCVNNKAAQALEREGRQAERDKRKQADAQVKKEARQPYVAPAAKAEGKEEEELFDDWQPGLCRATPERPIFTPTPPSSEGRLRRVDWDFD